ncbi:amino acid ABC transporter permease [Deinococcus humi]|uniref:Polar amino acid transport system permease protein n=1 Tax=Deinococcus humi TaxID=662880 RepID=A0A7W8JQ49_9DEIO|nr:amino acid ABC transporter permease [Deinococcus humi]MBB5361167.1 polar amino acid transport system permease protein [Deinococcus humi]GGO18718.1 glutamine ABC transporter permease [Deinococcus humi]
MADLAEGFRTVFSGDYPRLLLSGLALTLAVSVCALGVSVVLGTMLGVLRVLRVPLLGPIGNAYVEVVRGIPLIVLLSVVYYGLPALGLTLGGFPAAVLALGLYSAAYTSEIVRGGLSSVPLGQIEAGRSLGLSRAQAMRFVVLPQAWRVALPALGNEFVSLILGSSLASAVTLQELFAQGKYITGVTYRQFEVYAVLALIYFLLTFSLTRLVRALERRLGRGQVGVERRVI